MSENELNRIEKLFFEKAKALSFKQPKSIQNPAIHANKAEKLSNFNNIYSNYLSEVGNTQGKSEVSQAPQSKDLKVAMEEAEQTYESMMQIREELDKAFKELLQLQA